MVGAPLTFLLSFTITLVLGWDSRAIGPNIAISMLEGVVWTLGFALIDRLLRFP